MCCHVLLQLGSDSKSARTQVAGEGLHLVVRHLVAPQSHPAHITTMEMMSTMTQMKMMEGGVGGGDKQNNDNNNNRL